MCINIALHLGSYEKSKKNVLISVETLHYFKNSLEQVIHQNKVYFKQAQQYFNTGVRINAAKNILIGIINIAFEYRVVT